MNAQKYILYKHKNLKTARYVSHGFALLKDSKFRNLICLCRVLIYGII